MGEGAVAGGAAMCHVWMEEERGTDGVVEHKAEEKWSLEKTSVGEKRCSSIFFMYWSSL